MKIIGLTGFAKSGKSTAAEILKSLGGQEVAFAAHLKDVCSVVFNIPRDNFDNQAVKEVPFSFQMAIMASDVDKILKYFEVPERFIPAAMLAHAGTVLKSPRHVAQYVGTEILRNIDENIHINMALKLSAASTARFLVCSDVRFDNELKAVQTRDGLLLGISRKAATPADVASLHPSEREIPDLISRANVTLHNETTIEEFQNSVKSLALDYLGRK